MEAIRRGAFYWVRRRIVRGPDSTDIDIVSRIAALAVYVAEDGSLVATPQEARRYRSLVHVSNEATRYETVELVFEEPGS